MRSLRNTFLIRISRLLMLLIGLSLSGCIGYLGGPSPSLPTDECFTGIFSNTNISLQVVHNSGTVTAAGWKEPAAIVPWDYLFFDGNITSHGEASGVITLYFPEFRELTVPNVIISLPNDRACNLRSSLTFSIPAYTWEDRGYDRGNYSLTRP